MFDAQEARPVRDAREMGWIVPELFFFFPFPPTAVGLDQVCSDSLEFCRTYRMLLRETASMCRVVAGARPGVPHSSSSSSSFHVQWSALGLPSWEKDALLPCLLCAVVVFSPLHCRARDLL